MSFPQTLPPTLPPNGHTTPPRTLTPVPTSSPTPTRAPTPTPAPIPTPAPTQPDESHYAIPDSPTPTKSHRIRPFGPHEHEIPDPQSRSHNIRSYAEDGVKRFPRISRGVELMRNSYDCVVIGSGYGGAVAASRMARAVGPNGKRSSVCVLERGKERWSGEYPSKFVESLKDLHVSGEFAPGSLPGKLVEGGDPTGMYHLIFGKGLNAVVGNGLGGTSLMNANVFLEADKEILKTSLWPPEIRQDPDCLDKYYQKARDVLEPVEYPDDWPTLPKVELLRRQAEALGMSDRFRMVPQTTRFRNGINSCGVEMLPSTLTGQDTTGINDGSKTTTLVTYLADAWNWGAEMFCECEVRYVEKATHHPDGGYIIYFAWHGKNRGHFKANLHQDLMWVHAREAVFLGAGAIGTTEILLRSKEMGMQMSDRIGTGMSGNGDMLAFGYNTDYEANAIGKARPNTYNPIGPTINSMIDGRGGHKNPLDGFVIEEGAIPGALTPLFQPMLELMPGSVEPTDDSFPEVARSKMARLGSKLFGPYFQRGAIDNTQVYLVMSHDSSQATLTLKNDKPVLEYLGVGRSEHVKKLNQLLTKATTAVGGTFVHNPFEALMGQQQVTVHPVGGACMASDGTGRTGTTNHLGEVFAGDGSETYPGLIVTDGSAIPAALGVNPFATITALAERSVDSWCEARGLRIQTDSNGMLDLFGEPQRAPQQDLSELELVAEAIQIKSALQRMSEARALKAAGFGFTEVMSGYIHASQSLIADDRETYEAAERTARRLAESARFFLSAEALNTATFVRRVDHAAMLTGTFVCPSIAGSPFMVQRGEFHLFVANDKATGTRNLTYDFDLRGVDGRLLHFHGYKVMDSSVALAPRRFWRATTTLYVTVTEPHSEREVYRHGDEWRRHRVVAKGVMTIRPRDFASQLLTMTPTGKGRVRKALSAASFMTYFTRKSLSLLLSPLSSLQYPTVTFEGYFNNTPPTATFTIVASDGVKTRMHMWEPTHVPAGGIRNVFMVPGASVDHQIFALPTIRYNAVNYLRRAGYRVFVTVHRIGQLIVARNLWTTYDARKDMRACLEVIRANPEYESGNGPNNKVYIIAHCMGSVALAAGMLDGTVPTSWVWGLTTSQVFMNPIWTAANMAKVLLGPIPMNRLYRLFGGTWFSCGTSKDDSLVQRTLNQALRLYPETRREMCNNASCHRCSLVFGRLWNHDNLNEGTHRHVDRFLGGVNMTLMGLLMKQGYAGHVMTNDFEKLTTPENVARLEGIPMMLFVGGDNAVLSTESTGRTYETLCDAFGSGEDGNRMYRRRVVPGYGHLDCWMGRNAWRDVYPFVREEMDRVVRGERYKFEEPEDEFKRMVEDGLLF